MIQDADRVTLFRQIIEAHNLHVFFLPASLSGIESVDLQLRHRLYRKNAYGPMASFFKRTQNPTELIEFFDSFHLHWFHLFLPEGQKNKEPLHCIIGPFLQKKNTKRRHPPPDGGCRTAGFLF